MLNLDNADTRRAVEHCYRTSNTLLNPIIDWSVKDVWEYLHHYNCASNPLYQCGKSRVGCIGCPLAVATEQKKDFVENPGFMRAYVSAFDRMLIRRKALGKESEIWNNGVDVLKWWLGDDPNQEKFLQEEYEILLSEMGF